MIKKNWWISFIQTKGFKIIFIIVFFNLFLLNVNLIFGAELKVTSEHPFLVNNEWIPAKELVIGDELKTLSGEDIVVTKITKIVHSETVKVYNLEAGVYHNFVVNNEDLVVHNSNSPFGPKCLGAADKPLDPMDDLTSLEPDFYDYLNRYNRHSMLTTDQTIDQIERFEELASLTRDVEGSGVLTENGLKGGFSCQARRNFRELSLDDLFGVDDADATLRFQLYNAVDPDVIPRSYEPGEELVWRKGLEPQSRVLAKVEITNPVHITINDIVKIAKLDSATWEYQVSNFFDDHFLDLYDYSEGEIKIPSDIEVEFPKRTISSGKVACKGKKGADIYGLEYLQGILDEDEWKVFEMFYSRYFENKYRMFSHAANDIERISPWMHDFELNLLISGFEMSNSDLREVAYTLQVLYFHQWELVSEPWILENPNRQIAVEFYNTQVVPARNANPKGCIPLPLIDLKTGKPYYPKNSPIK